jgi:hypothetical protein
MQSSGESRRENAKVCFVFVIARSGSDEAIQNVSAERFWIASLALAMTMRRQPCAASPSRTGESG